MKTAMDKVKEFHLAADAPVREIPHLPPDNERKLRMNLLAEEYNEYLTGELNNDIEEICDALGDMVVIICGTAHSYGIPLDKVFDEIHRSNMTKVVDGKVVRRSDGKILKPSNYEPPNLKEILERP